MPEEDITTHKPNFRADFRGGPMDGMTGFLETAKETLDWFMPVNEVGDFGKSVEGAAKWMRIVYRLSSKVPHLVYEYVSSQDCEGEPKPS